MFAVFSSEPWVWTVQHLSQVTEAKFLMKDTWACTWRLPSTLWYMTLHRFHSSPILPISQCDKPAHHIKMWIISPTPLQLISLWDVSVGEKWYTYELSETINFCASFSCEVNSLVIYYFILNLLSESRSQQIYMRKEQSAAFADRAQTPCRIKCNLHWMR